jgi:hypothetical protein
MSISFDKPFPDDLAKELNARSGSIANRSVSWNYEKYAYIKMQGTGDTKTIIEAIPGMKMGDGTNGGTPESLYTSEDGIKKFKPLLKSVSISNQGAQDYTDSYIYEIEAQFTVYTQDDLDLAESVYMRPGAEIQFDFGWIGGTGAKCNKGSVKANVYNFSFGLGDDGAFDCTIKCMSPSGLWAGDEMGTPAEEVTDDEGEKKTPELLESLENSFRKAFGLGSEDDASDVSKLGDNKIRFKRAKMIGGGKVANIDGLFGAAELIVESKWYNDTENYIAFTNLDTLIQYLNAQIKGSDNTYSIAETGDISKYPDGVGFGSADPNKFFLPGPQGAYGDPSLGGGGNEANFSRWGKNLENESSSNKFKGEIAKIAISIRHIIDTYESLEKDTPRVGGFKKAVKVSDFLNTLFSDLETVTGGLISLSLIPTKNGEVLSPDNQEGSIELMVANKRMVSNSDDAKANATSGTYTFKILGAGSITKSVSLDSDFDSDMLVAATRTSVEKGTSNGHLIIEDGTLKLNPAGANGGLYPPSPSGKAIDISKQQAGATMDKLKEKRWAMGKDGCDPPKTKSYQNAMRNYINQNCKKDAGLKGGRYGEMIYTLNLGVTIDGIWGIPFLAPITIDRLPKPFKKDNCFFTITGVTHNFDGQGGWETSLETVMRIV